SREECVRDLLCRKTTDLPECQCDLGLGGKTWMAAGKNQPEAIILNSFIVLIRRGSSIRIEIFREFCHQAIEPGTTTNRVNGFKAPRGNEPRAGIVRDSLTRPLLH